MRNSGGVYYRQPRKDPPATREKPKLETGKEGPETPAAHGDL